MNPLSACAFGVACAILISVIRHFRPEYASATAAVAGAAVAVYALRGLAPAVEYMRDTAASLGAEDCFAMMLKALAVSVCCRLGADTCRDVGESSLASRVELAGRIGIVLISLPAAAALLKTAQELMQ